MAKKHTINTEKALNVLIPFILRGGGCRGAHDELAREGIDVSKSYSFDLFKMASEKIKEDFHKSWEDDYEYIKGEYQQLLASAKSEDDRVTQRQCLRDLMRLMGLEEKNVKVQFKAEEDTIDAFKKLFE